MKARWMWWSRLGCAALLAASVVGFDVTEFLEVAAPHITIPLWAAMYLAPTCEIVTFCTPCDSILISFPSAFA